MKIEKLDRIAIAVKDLDEAMRLFSDLFGDLAFKEVPFEEVKRRKTITEHADRSFEERGRRVALSPIGLELWQAVPPSEKEGVRSFHFKVSDIEQAKREMIQKGIRLLAEIEIGGMKEAIFSPEDLHGVRLLLVEYQAATPMDAILQKK